LAGRGKGKGTDESLAGGSLFSKVEAAEAIHQAEPRFVQNYNNLNTMINIVNSDSTAFHYQSGKGGRVLTCNTKYDFSDDQND
jgi:hypothetical protein